MALINPKDLYAHAMQEGYTVGAFNVANLEMLQAVIGAAEAERSPAFIMVSMGARKYVKDLNKYVKVMRMYAEDSPMPFVVHHDHCQTVENAKEAIDAGCQSVMFDGSHFDFETNIAKTAEVAQYAHDHGVWVEAELGCLPGFEDMVFSESAVYTNPDTVEEFIARSHCDSLAIAAGTAHGGVQSDDYLFLDVDLIKTIHERVPGYPLVLHGAASLPPYLIDACNAYGGKVPYLRNCSEEAIRAASYLGVCKANMDVDNFLKFTTAIRKFFTETPGIYDPRKYLAPARAEFEDEVRHKMRNVLRSADRF